MTRMGKESLYKHSSFLGTGGNKLALVKDGLVDLIMGEHKSLF